MTFNYNFMNMFSNGFSGLGFGNIGCGFGNIFGSGFSSCGSIFGNNIFYNSCNGEYNFDAMAGFAVGNTLLNVGGAALSSIIADKKQTSNKSLNKNLESINQQLDNKYDDLKAKNSELETARTEVSSAKTAVTDATNAYENNEKLLTTDKKKEYDAAKARAAKTPSEAQSGDEAIIKNYEDAIEARSKLKTAKTEAEKEVKAAKAKENKIQNEIDKLEEQIDNLESQREELGDTILDKNGGNRFTRVTPEELNAKFEKATKDGKETLSVKSGSKFTKRDFNTAVCDYKNAMNQKEKMEAKNKIKLIYTELESSEREKCNTAYKYIFG